MKFLSVLSLSIIISSFLFFLSCQEEENYPVNNVFSDYNEALSCIPDHFNIIFGLSIAELKMNQNIEELLSNVIIEERNMVNENQGYSEATEGTDHHSIIKQAILSFEQDSGFDLINDVRYLVGGIDLRTGKTLIVFKGNFNHDRIASAFLDKEVNREPLEEDTELPDEWIEIKESEYFGKQLLQRWHFMDNSAMIRETRNQLQDLLDEHQGEILTLPPNIDEDFIQNNNLNERDIQLILQLISIPTFQGYMKEGMMQDPHLTENFTQVELQNAFENPEDLQGLLFMLVTEQLKTSGEDEIKAMIDFFKNLQDYQ